jgi:hypothetical protein
VGRVLGWVPKISKIYLDSPLSFFLENFGQKHKADQKKESTRPLRRRVDPVFGIFADWLGERPPPLVMCGTPHKSGVNCLLSLSSTTLKKRREVLIELVLELLLIGNVK